MEGSKLPNKKEFDKIVEDAFLADERYSFSEQYKQKRDTIQRGITMKKNINKSERIFTGAVAAAVLAVVAIPAGVVMKNKLESNENIAGTDENAVVLEGTENPDLITDPDEVQDITELPVFTEEPKTYEFGWLPEDMSFDEDGYKIHRSSDRAGITPRLFKYSSEQELIPLAIYNFSSKDEYDLEGRHVKIYYSEGFREYEPTIFGRNIWITFEGSQYAVFLYVCDGIDDDDLAKIIENISLVPAEEDNSEDYTREYNECLKELSEQGIEWDTNESPANIESPVTADDLECIKIGDTFTDTFKYYDDHDTVMDITVTDAYITDSFDGLTTDGIGLDADFSDFADENGNIIDCYTEWYKNVEQPDGTTKKEIIDTETVGSKILIVDIKYENKSDAQDEYNIIPALMSYYDGELLYIDDAKKAVQNGECLYDCNMEGLDSERHFAFSLSVNGTKGEKNAVVLEPGESADVRLAFFIHEDEADDDLMLDLTTIDYGITNPVGNNGVFVKLSDLQER